MCPLLLWTRCCLRLKCVPDGTPLLQQLLGYAASIYLFNTLAPGRPGFIGLTLTTDGLPLLQQLLGYAASIYLFNTLAPGRTGLIVLILTTDWLPLLQQLLGYATSIYLFNTLAPGRPGCHLKTAIFNLIILNGIFTSSKDNALRWMPRHLTDDQSTLV